ncbi:tyrosine-type recombinase/integrase [Lentisalinibacter salinarum]|uniref:tyrosine-type recombinase/integrase n=1 Tax=Lentisalinibacter salinarum TaxID=2992239 RepID=UPI003864B060
MRNRVTKRAVDGFEFDPEGPAQQVMWDTELRGFGLRVYPSGRKSFVVGYRTKGRWRLMVLGQYGALTVDQARKKARKELGEVAGEGDPLERRQRERSAKTVRELATVYIEDCRTRAQPKKTWRTDERRLQRWIVPKLGSRKIEDVTMPDVEAIHRHISKSAPYEANRTVALVSTVWNFARRTGLFPADLPNPAQGVRRNRETSRAEYVTPDRLPDLARAIDGEDDPYVRAAFRLLLLTGMRRSELLNCTWSQVDLRNRRIFLPEPKGGAPRYVPLNAAAVELLRELPRRLGNEYVLPGHVKGRPLVNIDKPWRRIRERAGMPRLRIHDLRRTAGSFMVQAGHSLEAVRDILGHADSKTTQIYARLAEQQRRDTIESYGDALTRAMQGDNG